MKTLVDLGDWLSVSKWFT